MTRIVWFWQIYKNKNKHHNIEDRTMRGPPVFLSSLCLAEESSVTFHSAIYWGDRRTQEYAVKMFL